MGGGVRVAFAAGVGLLLPSASRAACGAPGLSDPLTWESIVDDTGIERCYKLFSGGAGDGEPFGTWADCAVTCQANGNAGYDGSTPGREATVGALRDRAQADFVSSMISAEDMPRSRDEDEWRHLVWIGFNSLEQPRENFRWATDEALDPASAVAQPVGENDEVALPWGGDTLWVGEEGSCAETQLCTAVRVDSYDQVLRGSLHQCDGPTAPARCLCEFSTVSSAAGTSFDTSDGVTPAACGDGNQDMCSSWGGDCRVSSSEAQVFPCRNGYTSKTSRADFDSCDRCTDYYCCDPRTTLSQTITAANEVVYEKYDGRFVDEEACHWEAYWHYYVIGYVSFYAVLFLGFLFGFLVACWCCAPKQAFSTRLQSCGDDVGVCCLTWWCPCITWGRIAQFTLDLPSWIGCLTYCCCSNLACCLGMVGRAELRKKLAISPATGATNNDCCVDCCVHCCAHSCALCQEIREINLVHSGGRPMPAPIPMGMLPVHVAAPTAVEGRIVGGMQPVQASAEAIPVAAVAVPHVVSGTLLPGGTGTYNPVAKPEQQP
jgi:Cys-rich protein (TIGR01571 family)